MITLPWPANLPTCVESWEESSEESYIESNVSNGPPKRRRRYTGTIRVYDVQMDLDNTQYEVLRDFYDYSLNSGVNRFTFDHPYTGDTMELEMKSPPKFSNRGMVRATVSMTWRELIP